MLLIITRIGVLLHHAIGKIYGCYLNVGKGGEDEDVCRQTKMKI